MTGGVDLMEVEGIGRDVLLTIISEAGFDVSQFPSSKHYTSWLALSPNRRITGGKVKSSHTQKRKNRLSEAYRNAANVVGNTSNTYLSEFFKRIAYTKGRAEAITATARKLAVIVYNMLKKKEAYKPIDNRKHAKQSLERKILKIKKEVKTLGLNPSDLFVQDPDLSNFSSLFDAENKSHKILDMSNIKSC